MTRQTQTTGCVSVIILTCNRFGKLQSVIAAILSQLGPYDEVIIVDTGSSDGTREWLRTLSPPIHYFFLDSKHLDFAAARNVALAHAQCECVVFFDDDCIPAHDCLAKIRTNLTRAQAVGGSVLPYFLYRYPIFWSPEIAWCAGMSPLGFLEKREDNYPATANMAAKHELFERFPFKEVRGASLSSTQKYIGGREDAQWWAELRRNGIKAVVRPQLTVFHAVPDFRFSLREILLRARSDGIAAWQREPDERRATLEKNALVEQIAYDLAHPLHFLDSPLARFSEKIIWSARQLAYLKTSQNVSASRVALALAPRIAARTARRFAGETKLRIIRQLRPPFRVPDPPHHILIAAPTYLGDTILLLPIVDLLQANWPEANILVWTRFPDLFSPTSPLVTVVGTHQPSEELVAAFALWSSEINFVPYYHFGPSRLWRKILSLRGISFSHDVGFSRAADYYYAARRVEKRFDQHEILNLLELVSLWPLAGSLKPPRLSPTREAVERLNNRLPQLKDTAFATIHIDTALEMKRWPLESWEFVSRRLLTETDLSVCFIGTEQARPAAQEMIKRLPAQRCFDCLGLPIDELVALIAFAQLAIGPCSGPKHIAYATRTPTFTLYGAVPEHRWGAWHDIHLHAYMRSPVEYLSAREQCGLPENHAMLLISAQEAATAILDHYARIKAISSRNHSPK
ncbi:MAG: glycosyltransferase [Candidatus Sumerlaeaceae bacterium]|jgi:ADP-heptose:LPS heptosyltransferase/glycosyltransferase involved in cell wall biosynthesis